MLTIFNQKLAGFLMLKGFKLLNLEDNKDFNNLKVFKFNNTIPLQKSIKEFQQLKKQRKV